MSKERRLVYSTETGRIATQERPGKRVRGRRRPADAGRGVRIRRETKGRGGKTVTVVTGLALGERETRDLLKQLKTQLGTGGAIKQGDLELQGDHRETVLRLLSERGISAKLAGG